MFLYYLAKPTVMGLNIIFVGCGNRAEHIAYNMRTLRNQGYDINIVGLADPDKSGRTRIAKLWELDDSVHFDSFEKAVSKIGKNANTVVNATPDDAHKDIAILAINSGYHMLLEKPMALNLKDCMEIIEAQNKSGKVLSVCHVLRYAPLFSTIKEEVAKGTIGMVTSMDLNEEVGHWHFVVSYAQNPMWNREPPIILSKSSHDLDILEYIIGKPAVALNSRAHLLQFKKENAPRNSTERCLDCPLHKEGTCIYDAVRRICPENYPNEVLKGKENQVIKEHFFMQKASPNDRSTEAKMTALKRTDYGRCAYKMNNTVPDTYHVMIEYEGGALANFMLTGHSPEATRRIKVYGTLGVIEGDLFSGDLELTKFNAMRGNTEPVKIEIKSKGGHGGGDIELIKDFVQQVENYDKGKKVDTRSSARRSLSSHVQAFAAEYSRLNGAIPINLAEFMKKG